MFATPEAPGANKSAVPTAFLLGDGSFNQRRAVRVDVLVKQDHRAVARTPQTAVAHMKHLFEHVPAVGDNVAIDYTRNHAQIRDVRERSNAQELAR